MSSSRRRFLVKAEIKEEETLVGAFKRAREAGASPEYEPTLKRPLLEGL